MESILYAGIYPDDHYDFWVDGRVISVSRQEIASYLAMTVKD